MMRIEQCSDSHEDQWRICEDVLMGKAVCLRRLIALMSLPRFSFYDPCLLGYLSYQMVTWSSVVGSSDHASSLTATEAELKYIFLPVVPFEFTSKSGFDKIDVRLHIVPSLWFTSFSLSQ